MPAFIAAGIAGAKGGLQMWQAGEARGRAQKAGRDANKLRVWRGSQRTRANWASIAANYRETIDSLNILQRNTGRQLDLADQEAIREWGASEQLRFDDYRRDAVLYNQSVEDYWTNINLNDISANMAYEEEKNFMEDFHIGQKFEKQDDILEHKKILQSDIVQRLGLRRQQEGFRAKTAFEDQTDIIQGLQVVGKLRATGAVGRSARKAVQVAGMELGSRQAMRADALMNSESMYYNEMKKLSNARHFAKLTRNLNIDKRAASLKSMLKASTLRQDKIAANKFSADLQAQRGLMPEPELRSMTPIPFEAFRPEMQEPTKPNQGKFYKANIPTLEDENKIYGDRGAGAPGNLGMDLLGVGLDMVGAYAQAGGFSGSSSSTPTPSTSTSGTGGLTGDTIAQIDSYMD